MRKSECKIKVKIDLHKQLTETMIKIGNTKKEASKKSYDKIMNGDYNLFIEDATNRFFKKINHKK